MKQQFGATALFFVLAVPVIIADRYWGSAEAAPEVVITSEVSSALTKDFEMTTGAAPTADEQQRLEARWVRDELMVSRAKELGLDRGDPIIRRRLLHKMRELASLGDAPTDEELRAYYEEHAERYVIPDRVDIDVVIPRAEDDTDKLLAGLRSGASPASMGRPSSLGVRQRGLIEEVVRNRLAVKTPAEVMTHTVGEWAAHTTRDGTILIRVVTRQGARPRPFESVRAKIHDALDTKRRKERLSGYEESLYRRWQAR